MGALFKDIASPIIAVPSFSKLDKNLPRRLAKYNAKRPTFCDASPPSDDMPQFNNKILEWKLKKITPL